MLKVVLVDDEVNVIEGMRASIDWEGHGCTIAGVAANGMEGLDVSLKCEPDIVITDITMPVMDGIEMAERIKENLPFTRLIFLTCHEDFNYARQALMLNACAYILKVTMSREELYASLDKVKGEIERERLLKDREPGFSEDPYEGQPEYKLEIIKKAVEYIRAHLEDKITLDSVAAHVNMNSSYFCRYFKSKTGESFVDFMSRMKIKKAKELILDTEFAMGEIAERVGYINQAYFTKVFKKCTGMNPGEFRRLCGVWNRK